MKEKWELFKNSMSEVMTMSRKEFYLTAAVCMLLGIVLGVFFSPRRFMVIGSLNGNNSGNGSQDKEREEGENED